MQKSSMSLRYAKIFNVAEICKNKSGPKNIYMFVWSEYNWVRYHNEKTLSFVEGEKVIKQYQRPGRGYQALFERLGFDVLTLL